MFDFEQLDVYQKALQMNKELFGFIKKCAWMDWFLQDQLKRAGVSCVANIAEGVGRFTVADRRHFYVIARGSVFEVYALLQIMAKVCEAEPHATDHLKSQLLDLSKMLFGLIRKTEIKIVIQPRSRT